MTHSCHGPFACFARELQQHQPVAPPLISVPRRGGQTENIVNKEHQHRSSAEDAEALARELGVDLIFEIDEPRRWSRLHNPLLLRWRLELAVLVAVVAASLAVGFALGLGAGLRMAG